MDTTLTGHHLLFAKRTLGSIPGQSRDRLRHRLVPDNCLRVALNRLVRYRTKKALLTLRPAQRQD
ncbi:MAG: hypothetical protein QOK46_1515 [Microbacteriaceae bacterium]|jgi:hypothetical protein|nr:hypothetical protein [Microbacteriaceae bacterium]